MPKKKKASLQQGQTNGQVRGHRQSTRKTTLDSYSSDLGEDEKFALPLQKVRMKGDPKMVTKSNDRDAAADNDKDNLHLRESTRQTTEQTSSSSDSDSSGLEDNEKFALMLQKVRMKGHPQMVTKSNDRDAAADKDKDNLHLNTEIQNVCPLVLEESERKSVKETNGFEQASAGKLVETASAQQFIEVDWPLKDEFHFRLACQQCFVKTGEGIKGYNYKEGLHHNCNYDIMLIKLKQRPDIKWIKVRPRAKHIGKIFNGYKICFHFTAGEPCSFGEEKCTFPHHVAEKRLWEMDRNGEFNIQSFIREIMWNKRLSSQPTQQQFQPRISPGDQGSQQAADADEMRKRENPLKSEYDFRIMCKECLVNGTQPGLSVHKPHVHNCEQNVLALYKRGEPSVLMRVRERTNHRDFPGRYIICNSIKYGRPDMCRFGKERCSFAHNRVEQILWTQEKEGSFNISEFILQNRSATGGAKGYTVEELLKKHGGNLKFICRQCFCARPPRIEELERKGYCSANREHSWKNSKVLAHIGSQGGITIINKRVFVHKSAYFKFCYWKSFCKNSLTGSCPFAHSMVERDVWMCERDGDFSQEQVVDKCNAIMFGAAPSQSQGFRPQDNSRPAQPYAPGASQPEFSETEPPARDLCPYNVQVLCGTCWKNGTRSKQDGSQDKCIKGHNDWHHVKIFMLMPDKKEIRPLPRRIPARLNFLMCSDFLANRECNHYLGGPCQFAHSEEEKDVWVWMCRNDIDTLDKLAKKASSWTSSWTSNCDESLVAASRPVTRPLVPYNLKRNNNYCQYCGVQCNGEKQWDDHCASECHNFNVNSDKDHQWNFRQPPWGSSYKLCERHMTSQSCQYSNVLEMYNLCMHAHSEEVLDEWKERYKWRQMKRHMAKQQKVFSYMDELLDKYESTDSGISVLSEEVNDVDIQCSDELHVYKEEKNAVVTWSFIIRPQVRYLIRMALLKNL
ncbi:zinc finger CCCH domain-containing protein 7B-like [Gigantopelta aegis]|uniref:zinc finger CCCH domain-containing protein 7B-like n=1 Tax=Gigantopelta aegis TaxID=1735272 RepID=UPI001B887769|nr:zinc finger CCCH domain-containing protein 7B-like [Gigantopelta aegis]